MISFSEPLLYWNYYLALEEDLSKVARFIEFSKSNLCTYSIELAHLLLSASSEVDVVLESLCKRIQPGEYKNINDYRQLLSLHLPKIAEEEISIDRYGLTYIPFENWKDNKNPVWWKSYNNVKHHRQDYFKEACLQNVLNAMGALNIINVYYYRELLSQKNGHKVSFSDTTQEMNPQPNLIKINANYYVQTFVIYYKWWGLVIMENYFR